MNDVLDQIARATRRALEQLDDRMLKDIGLGAHDIRLRSRSGAMPSMNRHDRF